MKPSIFLLILLIHYFPISLGTTTFTFINKCQFKVWPAILSNAGHPPLSTTGFELSTNASRSIQSSPGWSGRFWGRTGCDFDTSNNGSCATGDCGAGKLECAGSGETPPATLAEFSLAGGGKADKLDFYDVSLVDGYNLPMMLEGGNGRCAATGCAADLNRRCPVELRIGEGETAACRSACDAFRRPEYCCSGVFASPAVCRPTAYSEVFKSACPKSYSYAFDDSSSTFTCADAGEYTITFCPDGTPSQKSSKEPPNISPNTFSSTPNTPEEGGLTLENDYWFANLAGGGSPAAWQLMTNLSLLPYVVLCSVLIPFIFGS